MSTLARLAGSDVRAVAGHVDSSRVYELRRRRRWPDGRVLVAVVAVLAVGGGVASEFHAPPPAVTQSRDASRVPTAGEALTGTDSGPGSATRGAPPSVTQLPKVHVLRGLYMVHRLFRVHRLFYVRRRWWMR